MGDQSQSIEDLIAASQGQISDDDSAPAKWQAKQKEIKLKELERLARTQADNMGISYIDLFSFPLSPEALGLINEKEARDIGAICFYYDGNNIRLGAVNPLNTKVQDMLKKLTKKYHSGGEIYLISDHSLQYSLELYRMIPKVKKNIRGVELKVADLDKFSGQFSSFEDLQKEVDKAQVTDIITMVMAAALKTNSSDIHIEAEENSIKVRFRVDGVLHDAAVIDRELWKKIISRMKGLAKVKINIADKPQDGRLSIITKAERIDIRASFLPTNYGESVVMRLLRSSAVGLLFEDLGIRDRAFAQLEKEISRPNGMIITTGPTGSGKTTTLYAVLKKLNKSETKIITIEDPIEYQLEGVNQSQISERYTFVQGLRSIVRQDPDVLMVGEIRDLDTADIAIQAALTGHLVLSTIHTNDAAGTVPRFISMGAKPFLLAPALNAMIGQRLVRRICPDCKIEAAVEPDDMKKVKEILKNVSKKDKGKDEIDKLKFFDGKGCEKCQGIGYRGRIGIYEIMPMNAEIEKLILSGKASEYDMRDAGIKNGMITMVQDGLLKAIDGITSIKEVFRVAEEK